VAARIGALYLAVAATVYSAAGALWTDMWSKLFSTGESRFASYGEEVTNIAAFTRGSSPMMAMHEADIYASSPLLHGWWLFHPLLGAAIVALVFRGSRWGVRALLAVHAVIAVFAFFSLSSRPQMGSPWTQWWIYGLHHGEDINPQTRLLTLGWTGAGLAVATMIAVLVGIRYLPQRPRRTLAPAEGSGTSRELERRDAAFAAWAENYAERHDGQAPSDGIALPESLEGAPLELDPRDP
jgi:hypothetical protein